MKHYTVEIIVKVGIIRGKVGSTYNVEDVDILGENEKRYCINNLQFTSIEKIKSKYSLSIGMPVIYSNVNDSCFGTRISYSLYTLNKKRKSTIKREIAKYIEDKYSAFMDINLSFLGDE